MSDGHVIIIGVIIATGIGMLAMWMHMRGKCQAEIDRMRELLVREAKEWEARNNGMLRQMTKLKPRFLQAACTF